MDPLEWQLIEIAIDNAVKLVGTKGPKLVRLVRGNALEVGTLLARVGSGAVDRNRLTDSNDNNDIAPEPDSRPSLEAHLIAIRTGIDAFMAVIACAGRRDVLWPGANDGGYKEWAVSTAYHIHWARYYFWRGLDLRSEKVFERAKAVVTNLSELGRSCGFREARRTRAARAEIQAEQWRVSTKRRNQRCLPDDLRDAIESLQSQAEEEQDKVTQKRLYGMLGYVFFRLHGLYNDALTDAIKYYKKVADPRKLDDPDDRTLRELSADPSKLEPQLSNRLSIFLHGHLPISSYLFLVLWVIVLGLAYWFGPRAQGWVASGPRLATCAMGLVAGGIGVLFIGFGIYLTLLALSCWGNAVTGMQADKVSSGSVLPLTTRQVAPANSGVDE